MDRFSFTQDGRIPLHYTASNSKARQLYSVLVNAGVDATSEDNLQVSMLQNIFIHLSPYFIRLLISAIVVLMDWKPIEMEFLSNTN